MNKGLEYTKCFKDRTGRYFIENYLSTDNAGLTVPFKLFPRQIVFVDVASKNNNIIARKPRQSGITTMVSAICAYHITFCTRKETVVLVANKLDTARQFLKKIFDFLNQVPRWMWGEEYYDPDPKSKKNTRSIYVNKNLDYMELFNGCKVYARSSGENAARGISSATIVAFDEAAFIENGPEVYGAVVATTSAVPDAKIFVISTPHGQDPLYYQTYADALAGKNNFKAVEFRWWQDPRNNKYLEWQRLNPDTGKTDIKKDELISTKGEVRYDEAHWDKMIKEGWKASSPWFVNECNKLNHNSVLIAQELEVSFVGSADNVIPTEVIDMHKGKNVVEIDDDWPLRDTFIKDTWIWKEPVEGHRYICGVDPSSGSADDNTAIEIIDLDAVDEDGTPYFEQVLEYYGKISGDEIGELAFQYASAYNNALLVVEDIGGWGQMAIMTLLAKKYPNLYRDDPAIKTPTIERKYKDYNVDVNSALPGFHTASVRTQMISNLVSLLKNNGLRIRSMRVIGEMNTWIWKGGRPDHMKNCHDDALMCLAMTMFVAEYSMMKGGLSKEKSIAMLKAWTVGSAVTPKTSERSFMPQTRLPKSIPHTRYNPYRRTGDPVRDRIVGGLLLGGIIRR
ncbi:MAG: terminase family protein [Bacteroidales bacterium]|nr:terminase family protein [Bacteroidales bacterium]